MERSLNKRILEYKRDFENNTANTALVQRAHIRVLKINWNNARIIKKNDPKGGTIFEKKNQTVN